MVETTPQSKQYAASTLPANAQGQGDARGGYTPTTYSNYLFGSAGQNDKPIWSDSTHGRIAIRLLSRGVFGALAFAWGARYSGEQLKRYEPETWRQAGESVFAAVKRNPLQGLAKGFDSTLGRAIERTAAFMAPKGQEKLWAYEATRFRSKAYFHGSVPDAHGLGGAGFGVGRSLGAEMVDVTFNFAMASIADATVRNVIQGLDPNNKKTWLVDEHGNPATHGKFLPGAYLKAVGKASWRVLSKNQGEDWFAALPYVYQMKWQRQWIADHHPNFKLSADNHWHGASYLVNNKGEVLGDLKAAGAIDLHTRFVGYNWYTLMYREAYDMAAYQLGEWKKNGYKIHMPTIHNPVTATVDGVGSFGRYVLKSFIKSNIYMHPAMLFFWPMRVAQTGYKAGVINVDAKSGENAIISTEAFSHDLAGMAQKNGKPAGKIVSLMDRSYWKNGEKEYSYLYQTTGKASMVGSGKPMFAGDHNLAGSEIAAARSAYDSSLQKSTFSKIINPLGRFSYFSGDKANGLMQKIRPLAGEAGARREAFIHNTVNASYSYTPYMIAKAEFALRVDERPSGHELGEMDKSIYRFIDSVFTFRPKDACKAIGDIAYHAVRTKEHLSGREGGAPVPETPASKVAGATVTHSKAMPPIPANDHGANDNEQGWAGAVKAAPAAVAHPSMH